MPGSTTSQEAARTTRAALRLDRDRTVHASHQATADPLTSVELVRYDRQGRWYVETFLLEDDSLATKQRMKTVQGAVQWALWAETHGGEIHFDRPGGGHFDYAVRAAKEKEAHRAQR